MSETYWVGEMHMVDCGNCRTAAHPKRHHPFEKIERPMPPHQYAARGHVYKRGDTWFYDVTVGDRIVNSDNTGHWRTIFDGCNEAVWAFDRVLWTGHKIRKAWSELVDAAS